MKTPVVSAGFVLSLDGKIVTRDAKTPELVSQRGQRILSELRTDAVLMGRRTFEMEGAGVPGALRVVFSNSGRMRGGAELFRGRGSVVVFTTEAMPAGVRRRLEGVAEVRVEPRGREVDLRRALGVLARDYGVRTAHCVGGAELFRALVLEGLVRRLHVLFLPMILGGAKAPNLLGPAPSALLSHSISLRLEQFRKIGVEALAVYRFIRRRKAL